MDHVKLEPLSDLAAFLQALVGFAVAGALYVAELLMTGGL